MRVSEMPQQARPKGADRLHMAFHGMLADQDGGAWVPRADKPEPPSRCSVAKASTRASAQPSKTPNVLRRSVQASSTQDRTPSPGDRFISPNRGGRSSANCEKSPVAPLSVGYANRHTNRPVYTAVGISTPTAPAITSLRKSANSGLRAYSCSASPPRERRTQQQQPLTDTKASPAKTPTPPQPATPGLGTTTSAVIAALALDAALPILDPTAMALLETIMGGGSGGTASPLTAAGRCPPPAPAALPALSPLGPSARFATASPLTAAAATAPGPAPVTVLTKQLLQQHERQYQQAMRQQQQHQHRYNQQQALGGTAPASSAREPRASLAAATAPRSLSARAGTDVGAGSGPFGGPDGSGHCGRVRTPQLQQPSQPSLQSASQQQQNQGSYLREVAQPQSPLLQLGAGVTAGFAAEDGSTVRHKMLPLAPELHREQNQQPELPVQPPRESPLVHAGPQQQQHPSLEGSVNGGEVCRAAAATHIGGEESLQGSLSTKMLRSTKDDSRRPTTYAELQNASKLHMQHQHDQPSSPRQSQQGLAHDQAQPADSQAPAPVNPTAPATAALITAADGPPFDQKAPGTAAEGWSSTSSGPDGDRLSGARASPHGRISTNRLQGGLMVPETICERGSLELRTPTVTNSNPPREVAPQQRQMPTTAPQRQPKTAAKRGLFSGLFACFGMGATAAAPDDVQAASPSAPTAATQIVEAAPPQPPPTDAVQPRVEPFSQQRAAQPSQEPSGTAPTSTVAAVAAALAMSPASAAAHVQADSRLLLLLRTELGSEASAEARAAGATAPPGRPLSTAVGTAVNDGEPTSSAVQQAADGAGPCDSSPRTPRYPGITAARDEGGRPSGTKPPPATVVVVPTQLPRPSKSPAPPGSGSRLGPGMMPASPDGPADATIIVTRSPVGHLRHEDSDSVLRGSVDVHPYSAVASCLTFSPAAPTARLQASSRTCSAAQQPGGVGGLPRAPRQPLQSALDAAAGPTGVGGSSSRALLEQPDSACRERVTESPTPTRPGTDLSLRVHHLHGGAADEGTDGAATGSAASGGTPLRSSRKRSRATNACGGGALSQLDARKLAAMPLEEMLEQIQAAIAAEDLATGRTPRLGVSAGGMSDDGNILPMPPVMAKARSSTIRRRKSGAGGGRAAGHHSGGGGGGGPSRGGGRSTDGGTRGGAAGVGAVQTTLMKAATATAALGTGGNGGRRRRRLRSNRSPPLSGRRKPPPIVPPTASNMHTGQPVSPTARKSDGASSYGLPVWRHGGRAIALNGLGLCVVPTTTTSPHPAPHDNVFARQPPYKKTQLCTPTAATPPPAAASGTTVASVPYGGNSLGGVSPPRQRQSVPSPAAHHTALPPPAAAKTPGPAKTPGVVHTQVRTARRILDVDDGAAEAAQRSIGHNAALLAASSASKAATPPQPQIAKKAAAVPAATAGGPVTSSLNISDLLTRFGINTRALPAVRTAAAPARANAVRAVNGASPQRQPPKQPPPKQSLVNKSNGHVSGAEPVGSPKAADAGAPTAAAAVVVPSPEATLQSEQPEAALAHGSPASPPPQQQPADGISSAQSTLNKPRIVSVSLTELLLRASSVPDEQNLSAGGSGGGSGSSIGADAEEEGEEEALQQQQPPGPILSEVLPQLDFVAATGANAADGTNAPQPAPSASLEAPEPMQSRISSTAGRLSSTGGTGSALEPVTEHQDGDAKEPTAAAIDPARASVGYLDLLQAYSQATGGRASATLPHYAMPIASRATSAGGGSGSGSNGGVAPPRPPTEGCAPAACAHSPARSSPPGRPSASQGGMRQSAQSVGSYAQLAALRSSGTVAAVVAGKASGAVVAPASPAAACQPAAVEGHVNGQVDAGAVKAAAPPDAASTNGSPTHGVDAARAESPNASSVVAQLQIGNKSAGVEGLESTAAVRSGGVRLLEDTADSGGASGAGGTAVGVDGQVGDKLPSFTSGDHPRVTGEEAALPAPAPVTARSSLPGLRISVPGERQNESALADGAAQAAGELLHLQSSGSQPAFPTARSTLVEVAAAVVAEAEAAAAPPAALSPHQVGLPLTPRPSATPFADWRCVPLAAYEASLKEYDAYLAAPTMDDA